MFSLYFDIVFLVISNFGFEGGTSVLIASVSGHCLLAHLSQRFIGELIVYPCSGIRRCRRCCCRRPPFSNVFSSETDWPIKAKFYVEPPWEGGGEKVYINGPGHMTKKAAMPIYGKNL